MKKVICFYWKGDRWKSINEPTPRYGNLINRIGTVDNALAANYVNNLYAGVKRNTSLDFEFICFTNENLILDKNISVRPFKMITKMGVLPRMYMFSEEAGLFGHQVLCLDIDIVIVGNLDDILQYEGTFCARSKFWSGQEHKLDGDIMSFRADKANEERFWKPLEKDPEAVEEMTQGRERYWIRHVIEDSAERWDIVLPGQVVSYKKHVLKNRGIPKNARIVSCHGTPRPHQVEKYGVKNIWKCG